MSDRADTMRRLIARIRAHHGESSENREALAELRVELAQAQIESSERVAVAANDQATRLVIATWALVGMTAALVLATVVLIVVTATA